MIGWPKQQEALGRPTRLTYPSRQRERSSVRAMRMASRIMAVRYIIGTNVFFGTEGIC
jgi:hypothetical protein